MKNVLKTKNIQADVVIELLRSLEMIVLSNSVFKSETP